MKRIPKEYQEKVRAEIAARRKLARKVKCDHKHLTDSVVGIKFQGLNKDPIRIVGCLDCHELVPQPKKIQKREEK